MYFILNPFSGNLDAISSPPLKVSGGGNVALLTNDANWSANGNYIGAAITGQKIGDWYIDADTGINTRYYYYFDSATIPIRIAFTNVLLNG